MKNAFVTFRTSHGKRTEVFPEERDLKGLKTWLQPCTRSSSRLVLVETEKRGWSSVWREECGHSCLMTDKWFREGYVSPLEWSLATHLLRGRIATVITCSTWLRPNLLYSTFHSFTSLDDSLLCFGNKMNTLHFPSQTSNYKMFASFQNSRQKWRGAYTFDENERLRSIRRNSRLSTVLIPRMSNLLIFQTRCVNTPTTIPFHNFIAGIPICLSMCQCPVRCLTQNVRINILRKSYRACRFLKHTCLRSSFLL